MSQPHCHNLRPRKNFKIKEKIEPQHIIYLDASSFNLFLSSHRNFPVCQCSLVQTKTLLKPHCCLDLTATCRSYYVVGGYCSNTSTGLVLLRWLIGCFKSCADTEISMPSVLLFKSSGQWLKWQQR